MAWTNFTTLQAANSKVSASTFVVTLSSTGASAGAVVLVLVACDNVQTGDVVDGTDITSVGDSKGNIYQRAKTFTNGQASPGTGVTCGIFLSTLDAELLAGDTVTITFVSAITAKAVTIGRAEKAPESFVVVDDSSVLADDATDPGAISISNLENVEHLWVHVVGHEGVSAAYSGDADYSPFIGTNTFGSVNNTNIGIQGGARIMTGTTDTVDVTWNAVDSAQILIALKEVIDLASIREAVLDAMLLALNTGTPSGVPQARRSYLYSMDEPQLPSIALFPDKEDAKIVGASNMPALTERTLTVVVECRAKGDATNRPDQAVDPLLSWVVKALSGKRALTNTGPYHLIYEDAIEWDFEQMDHGYVLVRVMMGVRYQSKVNDAEAWA